MKKVVTLFVLAIFLTSFAVARPITSHATEDGDNGQDNIPTQTGTENEGESTQIQARVLTQAQVQEIKQEQKRIRIQEGECPEECDCTGSVMKCALENGGREMTVTAGQSGNIIIQVKGVEGSTNVTLYKSEGKMYGEFGEETRQIRVMPDMVRDKIRERVKRELEEEEIELDEEGTYQYRARKRVRILGLFRARATVRAEINAETGELVRIRNSWWAFLATEEGEPIVGASCATVSPTRRNECCQNKGYDLWDEETAECILTE